MGCGSISKHQQAFIPLQQHQTQEQTAPKAQTIPEPKPQPKPKPKSDFAQIIILNARELQSFEFNYYYNYTTNERAKLRFKFVNLILDNIHMIRQNENDECLQSIVKLVEKIKEINYDNYEKQIKSYAISIEKIAFQVLCQEKNKQDILEEMNNRKMRNKLPSIDDASKAKQKDFSMGTSS